MHLVDNFTCECGQVYTKKFNLKRHMANAHKGQTSFSCHFCPAEFCKRSQIVKHLTNIHAAKKPFICGIQECRSSYKTKRSMHAHQRNVHGNTTVPPLAVRTCSRSGHCSPAHAAVHDVYVCLNQGPPNPQLNSNRSALDQTSQYLGSDGNCSRRSFAICSS